MALDLSFKDLADVAVGNASDGRPLKVALDLIDEDPDQPRWEFPEEDLQNLAASIRIDGILQPIVVRQSLQAGRFIIVMGARRYRAAKLADLVEAPILIQDADETNPYAQMVENIQRDDLKANEIARFIAARLDAGEKQTEIARRLGKPRDWVSRYGAVPKMPPFLQRMLATSSIRSVYELYQAWRQAPGDVERAVEDRTAFTDAQARELAATVRSSGPPPAAIDVRAEEPVGSNESTEPSHRADRSARASAAMAPRSRPASKGVAVVRVCVGKRRGALVLDDASASSHGFARVAFDDGSVEDASVTALRIEAVLIG
ncbi:MAG: ParB/RepB/Spo0J family partition protein [Bosea sp.]|uniref:ParB/RepB/Spo0J family partition protein n=1 Tax=Bosea sp. (in: a-proteobacteria) TaxID=1871050 RepID=UPI0023837D9F|nr:ParB/RepB/Spo0J family partition protein [Bosea sp. (in: a-proteobacteria)]MCP4734803.1 ParB/RepB/Spo0J family partition protein [Bosea sp. (in: a-proteobacteria)]